MSGDDDIRRQQGEIRDAHAELRLLRGEGGDPPRRMTLSRIVELLLSKGASERSHVTLTRNAKGETQIEVKVQTGDSGDVQTIEEAESKAVEVYDRIRTAYPGEPTREQTTVELTRNAKGETQVSVQLRSGDIGGTVTPEQTTEAAMVMYDRMRGRYPMADGNTAKPGTVK